MERQTNWKRLLRRGLIVVIALGFLLGSIVTITFYTTYEEVKNAARAEEKVFLKGKHKELSLEDRSALVNYCVRNDVVPGLLPWWEYDNSMCSATVVKLIVLFTGIELVHAPAWKIRDFAICPDCVNNSRKLTTVWDRSNLFDEAGLLAAEEKNRVIDEVKNFDFDPQQVYVMGMLWEETSYWDQIQEADQDINSHVVLITRGKAFHFIHYSDHSDPLRIESLDELFSRGTLAPVWIARVHRKVRLGTQAEANNFRLPKTERELAFCQDKMPYSFLRRTLVFPRRMSPLPSGILQQADTFYEKSLLYRVRNGYDMYPTGFAEEVEQCVNE